jgi:hypothetical protein
MQDTPGDRMVRSRVVVEEVAGTADGLPKRDETKVIVSC